VFEPAAIPGMIDPGEQALLTQLAAADSVRDGGAIVEFGCFFGRSTAALLNGAQSWWTPQRGGPAVFAFDSFGCREDGAFAPLVFSFARNGGVEPLVSRQDGRISFYPVYRHYVGAAEQSGLLKTTVAELRDASHAGGPIALMHIDAPKYYAELKDILFRFFPSLTAGGAVVFQDYLYHWSATLIAAAQLMVEAGILALERSAASSMVARVLRSPTLADLQAVDQAMQTASVPDLIDRSLQSLQSVPIDRPDQFLPRVHLAKVQHLWEAGDFAAAQAAFLAMIVGQGGNIGGPKFQDFLELMKHGFTLRTLYELDH
jgi:hypothetical protein